MIGWLGVLGPVSGIAAAVAGVVTWYMGDRRKSKAEAAVAEQTISADVDKHDIDAREARLVYVQKQMDLERAFHTQQIADRDAEIVRQRTELKLRDGRITALLKQVDNLEKQLADISRQMKSVRTELTDLADHNGESA